MTCKEQVLRKPPQIHAINNASPHTRGEKTRLDTLTETTTKRRLVPAALKPKTGASSLLLNNMLSSSAASKNKCYLTQVFPAGVHWSAVGVPRRKPGMMFRVFVKRRRFDNTPQVLSPARPPLFYLVVP